MEGLWIYFSPMTPSYLPEEICVERYKTEKQGLVSYPHDYQFLPERSGIQHLTYSLVPTYTSRFACPMPGKLYFLIKGNTFPDWEGLNYADPISTFNV